jgi:Ser/Thr protein kinase RdoA (MazF antagonist)
MSSTPASEDHLGYTVPHMENHGDGWNVDSASEAVDKVLRSLGWSNFSLRLLRHGENITFDVLGADLVARITRPYAESAAVETEVNCACFLESVHFPANRLLDIPRQQPIPTAMGYLTLWQRVNGRPGDDQDHPVLGRMLAELHAENPPTWLRGWEPLRKIPARLAEVDRQGVLPREDSDFLRSMLARLTEEVNIFARSPQSRRAMCHGDAHTGNLIMVSDDSGVLVDWEDCSVGPPEWDFSEIVMSRRRFGLSEELYDSFTHAYGWASLESETTDLMERIRELTATSWLLQNAASSTDVLEEGKMRIKTMRDPSDTGIWSAF